MALTAFSALAGRALAGANIKRAAQLRVLMDDIQYLRAATLERLLPLSNALMEMKSPYLKLMSQKLGEEGVTSAQSGWASIKDAQLKRGGALEGYMEEDLEPLDALFAALSVSGRRVHEAQYAQALERLGRREEYYQVLGKEKLKLHTSLGALAGLALSVLLI